MYVECRLKLLGELFGNGFFEPNNLDLIKVFMSYKSFSTNTP